MESGEALLTRLPFFLETCQKFWIARDSIALERLFDGVLGIQHGAGYLSQNGFGQAYAVKSHSGSREFPFVIVPKVFVPAAPHTFCEEIVIIREQLIQAGFKLLRRQIILSVGDQIVEPAGDQCIDVVCERGERTRPHPREREDLIDEPEVPSSQQGQAHFRIGMKVGLVVERIAVSNQAGPIHYRGPGPEYVKVVQVEFTADVPARNECAWEWQARPHHLAPLQAIGANDADGGVLLADGDHAFQAFGKDPIVGEDNLAILARCRDQAQTRVVIRNRPEKLMIVVDADPGVFRGILAGNAAGVVGAAVIDDEAIPILISLRQNALNTLGKMVGPVVNRNDNAYERLCFAIHALVHASL